MVTRCGVSGVDAKRGAVCGVRCAMYSTIQSWSGGTGGAGGSPVGFRPAGEVSRAVVALAPLSGAPLGGMCNRGGGLPGCAAMCRGWPQVPPPPTLRERTADGWSPARLAPGRAREVPSSSLRAYFARCSGVPEEYLASECRSGGEEIVCCRGASDVCCTVELHCTLRSCLTLDWEFIAIY